MKTEEIEKITSSISNKLGKENVAIISDDIGLLLTGNTNVQKEIKAMQEEIETLKSDKEKLILANSGLLQQIPIGNEPVYQSSGKEESNFNFRDAFDEKGNFKK